MKWPRKDVNYDLMHKNPDNWKGILYANPNDPRLFVPKINPLLGYTLNLGNVYAIIGLVAVALIIITFQFLL